MKERYCEKCGNPIPEGRIKALPKTTVCVDCSNVERVGGFSIISGKTEYSELQVLPDTVATKMRKLQNRKRNTANVKLSTYVAENFKINGPKFGQDPMGGF